jgi:arylsulfatase
VREVVFAEQNWHVYRNHSRLVRWGDFAYIRNNFPNQINICAESDLTYPAGKELWQAHAAGGTTEKHWQVFANPCPGEELYNVREDPHQLTNLASKPEHAAQIDTARKALARWTEETGDTIPTNPTPNRHGPPRVVHGKVVRGKTEAGGNPHAEFPGAARNATKIHHPGPLRP